MLIKQIVIATLITLSVTTQSSQTATITCKNSAGQTTVSESYNCASAWGMTQSTEAFLAAGADPEKLAIGIAFYGRVFGKTQHDDLQSGLFQECSWCYSLPSVPAVVQYFAVKSALIDNNYQMNGMNWEICRDDVQQSPWAYTKDACAGNGCDNDAQLYGAPPVNFISYDDEESIIAKVQYAIDNRIGHLIIWELYGDDCQSTLLKAVHNTIAAGSFKPKVIAYYGNWRIYNSYSYDPYIPKGMEGNYKCSDAWSYASPVSGPRDWGITSEIAGMVDYIHHGFATVSYSGSSFFVNSPDPNADYQTSGLPTTSGCTQMLKNPLCLSPYIGAYDGSDCPSTTTNSGGYMTYAQCGAQKSPKNGLKSTAETYSTDNTNLNGVYNAWCQLKKENPKTKVAISIGGWYDSNYFSAAVNEKNRISFAISAARTADAFGFDRVDYDWEYPTVEHCDEDIPTSELPSWATGASPEWCVSNSGAVGYTNKSSDNMVDCLQQDTICQYPERVYDIVHMVLLFRDTKYQLDKMPSGIDVTAALRADPNFIEQRMPADLMNLYLASFNDMTYDYNAAYNKYAALNSPLSGCANPEAWAAMDDVDCVTTEFGALNSNGVFTVGAWSDCFGLCNGDNWGAASTEGLKMQFRKIITNPQKNGKTCGKLYNIVSCSGTCSQADPNIPDHYNEWKNYPVKYDCVNGECTDNVMGQYTTLEDCAASGCHATYKYTCNTTSGTCDAGLDGVTSEADCNASCQKDDGYWVQDWSVPCGCKKITKPWEGQVTDPNRSECCDRLCPGTKLDACNAHNLFAF